ncbi:MAG TPA: GNAT family N-acetyltransferase, partial [Spirochaetia bacterium]
MIEGPRAATQGELDAAGKLADEVFYPDGRVSMPSAFPALFSASNLRNLRVMVDNGAPVALAGCIVGAVSVYGALIPTASIGAVCTREFHRGMGLAGRVVEDALDEARGQGAVLALVSGGRSLYRRMGCIDAGLYRSIRVDRGVALPRIDVSLREWTPSDEPTLHALHHAEPIRHVRDPWTMGLALRTGLLFCKHGRTWVASMGGMA